MSLVYSLSAFHNTVPVINYNFVCFFNASNRDFNAQWTLLLIYCKKEGYEVTMPRCRVDHNTLKIVTRLIVRLFNSKII